MNWDELKKIVSSSDKIIIIDKGEPSFVVTTFDYYKKHFAPLKSTPEQGEDKTFQDKAAKSVNEDDLSIDDLPF